ncbi:MAG: adenylate kinase family protein [Thermonemataceae bacterium]
MNNIVLLGPPFSGKGTQCSLIADYLQLVHLSTGAEIRREIEKRTDTGMRVKTSSDKGLLAPDLLLEKLVRQFIQVHLPANGFLFDGYPRNEAQAHTLIEILQDFQTTIKVCIVLEVPEPELIERAMKRAEEEKRTDDNNPKVILKRLDVYQEQTQPIIAFLDEHVANTYRVNGEGNEQAVFDRIKTVL